MVVEELNEKLIEASIQGNLEVVRELISKGAYIEFRDSDGSTPLIKTCRVNEASEQDRFGIVKFLLEKGANIEAVNEDGYSSLMKACGEGQLEIVKELLSKGANIEAKNNDGMTSIIIACAVGQLEVVKVLLANGADIEAASKQGNRALSFASERGNVKLVKILLENGANIEAVNEDGYSSLMKACTEGQLEIVRELLSKGANMEAKNNVGMTPIIIACAEGQLEVVKELLAKGADIEAASNQGNRALSFASERGHVKIVKFLLEKGANIEAVSEDGDSSLMKACAEGKLEIVRELLSNGANMEAKNSYGYTPIIYASINGGYPEVVEELIEKGANYESVINDHSVFINASKNGYLKLVKMLLSRGADTEVKNENGDTPLLEAVLYSRAGTLVELCIKFKFILIEACSNNHIEIAKLLLEKGANIEARNIYGRTPVMEASNYFGSVEMVKELYEKGADETCCDCNGYKAVDLAFFHAKFEISELLRKLCVYLSFDMQDDVKVNEYLNQIDLNEELKKKESIEKADVVIFFLTKKFIESDQFKEDWSKRENKVFLMVSLENIQSTSFDLNKFNFKETTINSISSAADSIERNKLFISRLINFKKLTNLNNVRSIDTNDFIKNKIKIRTSIVIKKTEFLGNEKVVVQYFRAPFNPVYIKILAIDSNKVKTVARIVKDEQEFCWLSYLNQLFIYQKSGSNLEGIANFSLFTLDGILVRSVYSLSTNQYKVNSISCNKDNFEVYLNVFDRDCSIHSILILNQDFNLIKKIRGDITNPDFPLNYSSEIEIFNLRYNIFHFDSNIAFLQETGSFEKHYRFYGVKIFDKKSYSIVGVIETYFRLVNVFENKMLFMSYTDFYERTYLIQNIPNLYLSSQVKHSAISCKLNAFKESHLLLNPYSLPCGYLACLDCINNHFNIFKWSFKCEKCNQEHKFSKESEPLYYSNLNNFLNQDLLITMMNANNLLISQIDKEWNSFNNTFEYIEHEIGVRIDSLKMELDINGDKLISKINNFIRIKYLKQEETTRAENSVFQKFSTNNEDYKNIIDLKQIGLIYSQFYKSYEECVIYEYDENDENNELIENFVEYLGH